MVDEVDQIAGLVSVDGEELFVHVLGSPGAEIDALWDGRSWHPNAADLWLQLIDSSGSNEGGHGNDDVAGETPEVFPTAELEGE